MIIPLVLQICITYNWQQQGKKVEIEEKKVMTETQVQEKIIITKILLDEEGIQRTVEFEKNPDSTLTVKGEFIKVDPEVGKIIFDLLPCEIGGKVSVEGDLENVKKLDTIVCDDDSSHDWSAITFKLKRDKKLANVRQKTFFIKF